MSYHYKKKIEVNNSPEHKPKNMQWCKNRPAYQVRTDAGGMTCRFYDFATLSEARKMARIEARRCGWAEIFRWAESGTLLRKYFIADYTRELSA